MIFVTGDIHNSDFHRFKKFKSEFKPTKDDVLLVAGDFGLPWYLPESMNHSSDLFYIKQLSEKPFMTCFVDGNHENFDLLNALPQVEMFGNTCGKLSDKIFHLKRGNIYTIQGKKILALGGASSVDKAWRIIHEQTKGQKVWWKQELWTFEDEENCLKNLDAHEWKVDFVISHTCPSVIIDKLVPKGTPLHPDPTQKILEMVFADLQFGKWYFGHWHVDEVLDEQFYAIYQNVRRVE
jgi:predicted phosphodiesterase